MEIKIEGGRAIGKSTVLDKIRRLLEDDREFGIVIDKFSLITESISFTTKLERNKSHECRLYCPDCGSVFLKIGQRA